MSIEAIVAEVEQCGARHVVLTGGEPMIARDIRSLALALRSGGHHLTIETAATIEPGDIPCDLASLSPKLKNSSPGARAEPAWRERHEALRWQPRIVKAWLDRTDCDFQLKFVVCSPEDVTEIECMLLETGHTIAPEKIFLMPEGISLEVMRQRAAWLIDLCRDRGYRYAHRLHIELFGNQRGT